MTINIVLTGAKITRYAISAVMKGGYLWYIDMAIVAKWHCFLKASKNIYGYSYGIKSSRKLERETYHNMSFIWLMGGLKPDHKTIAEFRRKNEKAIQKVLKQCARMCIKLDLIAGNVLFVDGTKIRAKCG